MGPLYLGKMGTFVNFRYINNLAVPPGYDHQDFSLDILLAQSNLQIDAFPFLVVWLRFILICLNDLVFLLVSASGFALVSKEK